MDISVAIIGCGVWGKNIARNVSQLGILSAVCDTNEQRASEFSKLFSCPALSFEQILDDNAITGVIIVTNASSHEKLACDVLKSGKHVYVEKPLALSVSSALSIKHHAIETQKQVMVGHLLQYHPAYIELKNLVNDGFIGKLQHIQANRLAMGRILKSESALFDLCPHDISLILGLVKQMPLSIKCQSASHVTHSGGDIIYSILEFADDITAMMHTSWYSPFKEHRLVVTGNLGSIVFDDGKPIQEKLTLYRDRVIDEGETIKIERNKPIFLPVSSDEPLKNEISAFIQVCKSGEPALTDIEEALRVQQILSEMNLQINGEIL